MVVVPAEGDSGVEVGVAFVLPGRGVVNLNDAALAGGEGAPPAVAGLDGTPLRAAPRPRSASDVEDLALAADDQAPETRVTSQSSRCFAADGSAATDLVRLARTLTQGVVVDDDIDDGAFGIDLTVG